ncbi:hypothetical protein SVIOM342S_01927 [Streptomyces violaceorubidus]
MPHVPQRQELPAESADHYLGFLAGATDEERERGPALARQALRRFTGAVTDCAEDRHELVVTHNFLIAWLVRDAMHAPKWRWLGLDHANAALTVIRYAPGRAACVLLTNDMRHLPAELRWTGFPPPGTSEGAGPGADSGQPAAERSVSGAASRVAAQEARRRRPSSEAEPGSAV